MSMHNLTRDGEFRYIVQWFKEWSELQRDDFVPVLVGYLMQVGSAASENASAQVYMNGVVHAVANTGIHERPMSLFQCRIKLFREWSIKWPEEFKQKLLQKITEIDNKVGEKIINELKITNNNGDVVVQANGIHDTEVNNIDNDEVANATAVMHAAQSLVAETEMAINADVRLVSQLLEQITPVADNNCNIVDVNDVEGGELNNDSNNGICEDGTAALNSEAITTNTNDTVLVEPAEPVQFPTQEHVTTNASATNTASPAATAALTTVISI